MPHTPLDAPPAAPESTLGDSPHEPKVRPWELELLISGAVTFALVQLPGAIDRFWLNTDPHLDLGAGLVLFLFYYSSKLILYALIASFVLHLAVRAYWVGLIGLESVFPRGIQWDQTRFGPVTREVYRERLPTLQQMIDRTDRLASVIFSFAFTIVFLVGFGLVFCALAGGLSFAVSQLFLDGRATTTVFMAITLALSVLPALLSAMDKRLGERAAEGSGLRRFLRASAVFTYYLAAMPFYGSAMTLLTSNRRRRLSSSAFGLAAVGLMVFFMVKDVFLPRGAVSVDGYAFIPDVAGRFGVEPAYYESQRRAGQPYEDTPSIQSDVVREPYVRLFVPYYPARHNRLFARRCPELKPFPDENFVPDSRRLPPPDSAQRAVLACWARVQPVTLNGRPLAVPFRFYTHPRTGSRGIVAHVPTAGLPRGENVITVARTPRSGELEAAADSAKAPRRPPHYISFWL